MSLKGIFGDPVPKNIVDKVVDAKGEDFVGDKVKKLHHDLMDVNVVWDRR